MLRNIVGNNQKKEEGMTIEVDQDEREEVLE